MLRCVAVLFALFATSWARAVWMPMPHEYPPSTVARSRASRNLSCDTCLPTLQIQLEPVCEKKACPQLVFHFVPACVWFYLNLGMVGGRGACLGARSYLLTPQLESGVTGSTLLTYPPSQHTRN